MLPDPHDLEQEGAFMRGVAAVARTYYLRLIREGFTPEQAYGLVAGWQHVFVQVVHAPHDPFAPPEVDADPSGADGSA